MKIDFHTHILPAIDDGSESVAMSNRMLSELRAQQVDVAVLTPHYYSHHKPIAEFTEQQQQAYRLLCASVTEPTPRMIVGAEVYFSDYLFNNRDLTPLCIQNTRTMLLELPYNKTIDTRLLDKIDRLICEYNLNLVLAHIERYPSLLYSRKTLERLLDMGCVLQVNLPSFTMFGKRRLASLVRSGYIGALGTDAHNISTRSAEYNEGYRTLEKLTSGRQLKELQRSMAALLGLE